MFDKDDHVKSTDVGMSEEDNIKTASQTTRVTHSVVLSASWILS